MGHPYKFQRVLRLGSVTARHLVVGSAKLCGVEQTAPPMFGRATIRLGIGSHSSSDFFTNKLQTIRDTIGAALKSCTLQQFRDRVYDGQPLADLHPVTAGDVMKIGDHA